MNELVNARLVEETLILQKVNAAHRLAFKQKYPGQCQHVLRLIAERLQALLTKRDGTVLHDPATWTATPDEIAAMSAAMWNVYQISREVNSDAAAAD